MHYNKIFFIFYLITQEITEFWAQRALEEKNEEK